MVLRKRSALLSAVLGAALLALVVPAMAAFPVERVDESDLGTSWFASDEGSSGDGGVAFVDGPETPPLGVGSAQISTNDSNDGPWLRTTDHAGTPMADVTELSYATYRDVSSTVATHLVPSLQFGIDANGDGTWDGRLIFEPIYTYGAGAIIEGEWQTWDAYGGGGTAIWWSSRPIPGVCAFDCFVAWDDVLAANPDAQILELGVKAGSGWTGGFLGNVDALTIGTGAVGVTYDFEHEVTLEGKEECKDGGWMTSTDPVFRNQGDCVSFHASDGRTHGG